MGIKVKELKIGEINNSSGMFSGDNLQVKWNAFAKSNEGYGILDGNYNKLSNTKSIIIKSGFKENI
ncbi:hypothetical protein [Sporohalobacter salinus]|uniref:hypothetical protein n=1 Tax=Sporohalobacter salinus TaxID=1494606 RepID=UPI00195FE774|nr:hypothetical protein [Sporohalobacter salinus]MBM7624454.1 hypothetical protein [Sporohalobacter salinus]